MEIKSTKEMVDSKMKSYFTSVPYAEEASEYYVEINSGCNLKCNMCPFSCKEFFTRKDNIMDLDKFSKIIKKISTVSPNAFVSLYHHSEPFLNKNLDKYVDIVKEHGLKVGLSSNFVVVDESVLRKIITKIEVLVVSVSGYYNETYLKSHVGGDVNKVKENLKKLYDLIKETGSSIKVHISYHMYKDNLGKDYQKMQELAEKYDYVFTPIWSRSINIEMSLKYLRQIGKSRFIGKGLEWIDKIELPEAYFRTMDRMVHKPDNFLEGEWAQIQCDICPCINRIVTIHHDGKIESCSCGFDDELNKFDYLTVDMEEYYKEKSSSLFCKECLANNLELYVGYMDLKHVEKDAYEQLKNKKESFEICEEVIGKNEKEIIDFAKKHSKVYIYGAGGYGMNVKTLLENCGQNIDAFVVTHKWDTEVNGIKLLSVDEIMQEEECGIIVAMNRTHKAEICNIVKELKCDIIYAAEYVCL